MRIHQLRWQEIQRITVTTYPQALAICNRSDARTAADAIYDLPTILALAVVHGDAAMRRFGAPIIGCQPVQAVRRCITLQADPELERDFPVSWPAIVDIGTVDGRVLTHRRDLPRGEPEEPFGYADVEAKFHQLASATLGDSSRHELLETIHVLEKADSLAGLFAILGRSR
jgi:2-methylcitrate dehydratase PrpD